MKLNFETLDPRSWKPRISNDVKIVEVDGMFIFTQTILGYQLSVNKDTFLLLSSFDGTKTLEEISKEFDLSLIPSAETDNFFNFLQKNFIIKGFIETEASIKKRPNASFLFFKFSIIKEGLKRMNNFIFFDFLFREIFFYPSFFFVFLLNLVLYVIYTQQSVVVQTSYWGLMGALFLCHFIHEWGHVLSAKSFGAKPKEIGFGIYLVLPVFYTDLSDCWNIPSKKRIIVNLSGIYFDYILSSLFYLIFYVTGNYFFVVLATLNFIKSWYNLNPLLQSDMYWVFSDFFKRPNLTSDAINAVIGLRKNLKKLIALKFHYSEYIVLCYGCAIIIFWGLIIYRFSFFSNKFFKQIPDSLFNIIRMVQKNTFEFNIFFESLYNIIFSIFIIFIIYSLLKRIILVLVQAVK